MYLKRQKRMVNNESNMNWQTFQCFWTVLRFNYQWTIIDALECRCFYKRTFVRVEFLHLREQTKIKRFTDLSGIRFVRGRTMQANYLGELCGTNWIDEPRLYKEYKGLLGVNYANRAHLVSVGKLGWVTMSCAELSAKSKHNIKSFSKFKELPSLEVTCVDE